MVGSQTLGIERFYPHLTMGIQNFSLPYDGYDLKPFRRLSPNGVLVTVNHFPVLIESLESPSLLFRVIRYTTDPEEVFLDWTSVVRS